MIVDVGLCRDIADEVCPYMYVRGCRSGSRPRLCYPYSLCMKNRMVVICVRAGFR